MYGSADVSMFRLGGAAGVLFVVQSLGGGGCFALKAHYVYKSSFYTLEPRIMHVGIQYSGPNSGKFMC